MKADWKYKKLGEVCKDISSKWVFYCLQNNGFYNYIEPLQTGASYPAVTDGIVKGFVIPVPSLKEQQRIVKRLDAVFRNIDELKANAEKQLAEARILFQKCLAKAMEPKEGWEEKKLGDVCELVDLKTAEDEQLTSGKFTFNDNDVFLYNKIRPYLMKVARPRFCGLCGADMYPLTPKESITKGYLFYVLISMDFTDYAIINSGRAGMPKVNRQTLFAYKCSIPPIAVQQSIVERLDALGANIRNYEVIQRQIISECDALKQALLRKVFE